MSNEKVIPTAWLIAHCRTFSDIPFSKEIFSELERTIITKGETIPEVIRDTRLAPQFEARYKLINRLLKQSNIKQILEIAVGLSSRGLEMTEQDESLIYIETDFPKLIEEKQEMFRKFKKDLPSNLYFESADALNIEELKKASRRFDQQKPLAVINEGLLRYLSFEEKAIVARNIRELLKRFGGVWITPDISKKRIVQASETVAHGLRDKMNEITGINIDNNLFNDEQHAVRFFEEQGFDIERHSFMEEIDNLVSPENLNISYATVKLLLENSQVFIMKVKP